MPVWGSPLRRGLRLAQAVRSPRSMATVGSRQVMGLLGLGKYIPIIGIIITLITMLVNVEAQRAVAAELQYRAWVAEHEEQRKRKELVQEVLAELRAEERENLPTTEDVLADLRAQERENLRTIVPGG